MYNIALSPVQLTKDWLQMPAAINFLFHDDGRRTLDDAVSVKLIDFGLCRVVAPTELEENF